MFGKKLDMPSKEQALPGRDAEMSVANQHYVNNVPIKGPFPDDYQTIAFGMGCFWGAERRFWRLPGVYSTAAGYAGGFTPNPSYEEVCSGGTGHNEVVQVVYDPAKLRFEDLLKCFWESHDPTQGMRQGNDRGTQYRSGIYTTSASQLDEALSSRQQYENLLSNQLPGNNHATITTEIKSLENFYYAEDYHQQYLAKNPNGYCGLAGTGVTYQPC